MEREKGEWWGGGRKMVSRDAVILTLARRGGGDFCRVAIRVRAQAGLVPPLHYREEITQEIGHGIRGRKGGR